MNKTLKQRLMILASLVAVGAVGFALFAYQFSDPFPPIVKAEGIRVVAIGDSITYGHGAQVNQRDKHSYPGQLQALLGSEYQVLNYGLSGTTLLKSGDSPYWDNDVFTLTQEVDPAIVLIMLGTNDSKPQNWNAGDYESQLVEFVNLYKNLASHPTVYLMTPPAAFGDNDFGINKAIVENEVVPIVLRVAEQTNTPSINVFAATKDHAEYFPDGVHPNAHGNKVIAETVHAALTGSDAGRRVGWPRCGAACS